MIQSKENIVITATYQVEEENLPVVLELLRRVQSLSVLEKGCIYYQAHQTTEEPGEIFLYEIYENEKALNQHRLSQHFQEIVVQQIVPLLQSRNVSILKPII